MAIKKIDGIVEVVRYQPDGQVKLVRVYQRVASTYTDRILLSRGQLVDVLKAGKRYVAGHREQYMGATFETGSEILLVKKNGKDLLQSAQASGDTDDLKGVPLF